ncbi:hypothetical protein PHYSODRAFT_342129 [Phytophthora sojae]|uniref:Uncharacterized protein n=1 Tax=Phytophthora sojae (strain P6497) TaxID=1094619 RepID=G5AFE3_PHYSP|nr:hypothetical protein PHYSODRAFT_342129 [Phytophthora sojae]EGZ05933.1 hypothetical protein PHYSODRAFT_342129 [Phytophthora sojae]|eukprot:XP_009538794.1 hypothetical protein PHYSODRAFT_342129 [Phytophthora sojae]
MYAAPLCHPGICETPDSAISTVDVFVRRIPAANRQPDVAPNVWLVQGGPYYWDSLLDIPMLILYNQLKGEANVYTMDYRGTGQSTPLKCAAQAKSSSVVDLDLELVPACAKELEEKYGDLAAFSTTSAAMDLTTFISKYGNDFSTTLYGVSYGTIWVERVMHLNPPEVTGYVLDRAITTSLDNFYSLSDVDGAFDEVADSFMALCSEDSSCNARFKKNGLKATLQQLMMKLDKNPKATCAKLLRSVQSGQDEDPPSFVLRYLLGQLLLIMDLRTLIPPIVYRLFRCAKKDVAVLTKVIETVNQLLNGAAKGTGSESIVLNMLVDFSEIWEAPSPSAQELRTRFEGTSMNSLPTYKDVPSYCAFSKEKSPTCNKLKVGNYEGNGIIYERDEYWNKAAKIPEKANVLLMSDGLDPISSPKYAQALLKALDGQKKELVTFKYGSGDSLIDSNNEPACRMYVLSSFVQHDGDLTKLNKTCLGDEAAFSWTIPEVYQYPILSTKDAYDGEFDPSLSADEASSDAGDSSGSMEEDSPGQA